MYAVFAYENCYLNPEGFPFHQFKKMKNKVKHKGRILLVMCLEINVYSSIYKKE